MVKLIKITNREIVGVYIVAFIISIINFFSIYQYNDAVFLLTNGLAGALGELIGFSVPMFLVLLLAYYLAKYTLIKVNAANKKLAESEKHKEVVKK